MAMTEAAIARLLVRRQRLRQRRESLSAAIAEIDAQIGSELPGALGRNPRLTARQKEVLDLVAADRSNKEIAEALHITVRTVKFHVSRLLQIFGVTSRREMAKLFVADDRRLE